MYCGQCGRANSDGARFCVYCGRPLPGSAAPPAAAAGPPRRLAPIGAPPPADDVPYAEPLEPPARRKLPPPLSPYHAPYPPAAPPARARRPRRDARSRRKILLWSAAACTLLCLGIWVAAYLGLAAQRREQARQAWERMQQRMDWMGEAERAELCDRISQDAQARDDALQTMIPKLAASEQWSRRDARQTLDRLDPNWARSEVAGTAVPQLIGRLGSIDDGVADGAADALGDIGDRRAIGPLVLAAVRRTRNRNCLAALDRIAAGWATGPEAAAVVEAVAGELNAADIDQRRAAAEMLGRIGNRLAAKALILRRLHEEEQDRLLLETVLDRIDADWRKSPAMAEAMPEYVQAVGRLGLWDLHDNEWFVREVAESGDEPAMAALLRRAAAWPDRDDPDGLLIVLDRVAPGWQAGDAARKAAAGLVDALPKAHARVAGRLLDMLASCRDRELIVPLCLTALTSPDLKDRCEQILAGIDPNWRKSPELRAAMPRLAEFVLSSRGDVRRACVELMAETGGPAAVKPLLELLDKPHALDASEALMDALDKVDPAWASGEEGRGMAPRLIEALAVERRGSNPGVAAALGRMRHQPAIGPLIVGCCFADEDERPVYETALSQIDRDWRRADAAADAANALIGLLADREPTVRVQAARMLAELKLRSAVEPLIGRLEDPDANVRAAAMAALAECAGGDLPEPLLDLLLGFSAATREAARQAVERIDPQWQRQPAARKRLEAVAAATEATDPGRRADALRLLGRLEPAAACDMAIRRIGDAAPACREAACEVLGAARDRRAFASLFDRLADDEDAVRAAAMRAIQTYKPSDLPPADQLQPLAAKAAALAREDEDIWPDLSRMFDGIGAEAAGPFHMEVFRTCPPAQRAASAAELGRLKWEPAAPLLAEGILDADAKVVEASGRAVDDIRPDWWKTAAAKALVPPILEALPRREDPIARQLALRLGQIGDARAVDALAALAKSGKDSSVRRDAVVALGNIGDPRGLDAVIGCLADRSQPLRAAAADAIGSFKGVDLVDVYVKIINAAGRLRTETADLAFDRLQELGSPEAVAAFLDIARSDTDMGEHARQSRWKMPLDAATMKTMLEVLLAEPDGRLAEPVRRYVINGLYFSRGAAVKKVGQEYFPRVLAAADLNLPKKRYDVLVLAGLMDMTHATASFCALLKDPDPQVRLDTLDAVRRVFAGREITDIMLTMKFDPDWRVRYAFKRYSGSGYLDELPKLDAAAEERLVEDLASAEPKARETAIELLGQCKARRAAEPIAKLLATDRQNREEAIVALGKIADPRTVGALLDVVNSKKTTVNHFSLAVEALQSIGGEEARAGLQARLTAGPLRKELQEEVRQAIAKLGGAASRPASMPVPGP